MHDTSFLSDVLFLLAGAVAIVTVFRFLRMSPVLGYLVAGAAIGPYGLHIVRDVETAGNIAEIGIVFLLFMIGLELSLERLRDMRRHVFGLGTLQVGITAALVALAAVISGLPGTAAIIIGGVLAFSSTAIVLQVVEERGESSSQIGRLSLAMLILQDLAVVPLLVLIPILASDTPDGLFLPIVMAMLKVVGALFGILIIGRLLLRPFFRLIASTHSPELFAATTLLVVLGTSYATEHAGLSLALGAFVAGLLLAETEYQHQVEADVLPFKGLFMGLFFMTVGMALDIQMILQQFWLLIGMALALMVGKGAIIFLLCRFFQFRRGTSLKTAALMAQGSEFAFIMFALASQEGVLPTEVSQFLMVMVTISMALTPPIASLGDWFVGWMERHGSIQASGTGRETTDLDNHVIVAGYGRLGQMLVKLLQMEKINFVAIDLDPRHVAEGRQDNLPVFYGNARRDEVLEAVGIERAQMIVFTFSSSRDAMRSIQTIRRKFPNTKIVARAMDRKAAEMLSRIGVDVVVRETLEAGLNLGGAVLRARGTPGPEVSRVKALFRDKFALDLDEEQEKTEAT